MVDAVDLEQVVIEREDEVAHFPLALQAMVAALHFDDTKIFMRELRKCNHTMEYANAEPLGGDWMVKFKLRRKNAREMEE